MNLGFDLAMINLDTQNIPDTLAALVVADPKTALSNVSQQKIRDYIDKGGNMIIMGEPGKQQILNPILRHLGVELLDGNLVEPTYDEMPQMVKSLYTTTSANLADELLLLSVRENLQSKYPYDTVKILTPGVAALSFTDSNGFVRKPLLLTNGAGTWLKKGKLVTDSAEIVYNPQEGDIKGSFPTSLHLSRQVGKKQQNIAIFGDADYVSNARVLNGETINRALYYELSDKEYPVYLTRPNPLDNLFTITTPSAKMQRILFIWVLPAILLVSAIVLLVRRKRK